MTEQLEFPVDDEAVAEPEVVADPSDVAASIVDPGVPKADSADPAPAPDAHSFHEPEPGPPAE